MMELQPFTLKNTTLSDLREWFIRAGSDITIAPQRYDAGYLVGLIHGKGAAWNVMSYEKKAGTLDMRGRLLVPRRDGSYDTDFTETIIELEVTLAEVSNDLDIKVIARCLEQDVGVQSLFESLLNTMDVVWPEAGIARLWEEELETSESGRGRGRRSEWHDAVRLQVVKGYLERKDGDKKLTAEGHCRELSEVMAIHISPRTLNLWVEKVQEGKIR